MAEKTVMVDTSILIQSRLKKLTDDGFFNSTSLTIIPNLLQQPRNHLARIQRKQRILTTKVPFIGRSEIMTEHFVVHPLDFNEVYILI